MLSFHLLTIRFRKSRDKIKGIVPNQNIILEKVNCLQRSILVISGIHLKNPVCINILFIVECPIQIPICATMKKNISSV